MKYQLHRRDYMTISIIIPTFNEGKNIQEITTRIQSALQHCHPHYEIWFIDDSQDDTPQLLHTLAATHPNVHYIHRTNTRGLGSAVVHGFAKSKGDYVIVMDADLQHPPEVLPVIIAELQRGTDIVIPSRFMKGGSDGGLNTARKLISLIARKIGQLAIKRMRNVTDCTSGYFGINRTVIEGTTFHCVSWKILMEVLMKGHYHTLKEIPYHFTARDAGESKMSLKEQWNYLWHIAKLVWSSPSDRRFYLFCFVGLLGLLVNLLIFNFLLQETQSPTNASIIASMIGMLHNYIWHDTLTWKDRKKITSWKRLLQFPQFVLVSLVGVAVTALIVKLFINLNLNPLIGQITGIGITTLWNYFANHWWTWRKLISS